MKKIKKHCENTIEEMKSYIFDRAENYATDGLTEQDKKDLLAVETVGIVAEFDPSDLECHNFDLGKLRMAEEILALIEK